MVPRSKWSLLTLVVLMAMQLSACNHLFYHPQKRMWSDPSKAGVLRYEATTIRTRDGESLAMWRMRAKPPHIGNVLHFHGNGENMSTHYLFVAWLTLAGFDVYTFDYRGYGESSGEADRDGLVLDGVAAIYEASETSDDLFIIAQSLGGAVALPAVVEAKSPKLRAIYLESTFSSYREVTRSYLRKVWLTWLLQYPLSFLVSDHFAPGDAAPNIKLPVLMAHGRGDPIVPYDEGRALFERLGTQDKRFVSLETARHTPTLAPSRAEFRYELLRFFCAKHSQPRVCEKRNPKLVSH